MLYPFDGNGAVLPGLVCPALVPEELSPVTVM